ncbi:polycomb protein Sfmbt [Chrysoperla carnea]|uniref:polycomb protein Sfmbt n=1 Tax=Chrysoperla carnea TaxID=189513 RepID=UPI001D096969|nr:polycomb protein Sfmbt [Chrysoperla carnea]
MNVYTMPGVSELGMVWMGAGGQSNSNISMGLMPHEASNMMMDHDSPFFASHHSTSNHSTDDMSTHTPKMEMDDLSSMMIDSNDTSSFNLEDFDEDNSTRFMMSTATQTATMSSRKIKPIKHPGLVLKTPIAYQSNTDPSVIPIQKDGMAVCEKCGAIGVKHAFYTRERRFCSMACARGYSGLIPEPLTSSPQQSPEQNNFADYKFKIEPDEDYSGLVPVEPLPQLPTPPTLLTSIEDTMPFVRRKMPELANTYEWNFSDSSFVAAPVSSFPHAPIADIWDNILVGMKVEVENTDSENFSEAFPDSFWVATVLKIIGYKALMRYEGFGTNSSKDFWVSLCSATVHPVGWCATRGKPLIPPKTIEDKYNDWKDFLVKRLTGARTLPSNFYNKVSDSMKSRFRNGLNLEVVDKNRISQVKVAMVHSIVGKRLNVRYHDSVAGDQGFWCHEDSPLIHPVGWARMVGHTLDAPLDYIERINEGIWDEDDATATYFTNIQSGLKNQHYNSGFCVGMKLEAVDPLNLSSICVATVMDVLKYGYIMIRIDTYDVEATGADWFCYHISSPCIFPVGFCEMNSIPLTPPKGYDASTFNWIRYLQETNNIAAPECLFARDIPPHNFKVGMKLEAADLMDPRLVCVATISRVVGRLIKVSFDGWEEEYDQWLDCESPDIYPVGWCQMVGHKLEGPRLPTKPNTVVVKSPKGLKKRGRKKKNKDVPAKPAPPKNKIHQQQNTAHAQPAPPPPPVTHDDMIDIKEEIIIKEEHQEDFTEPETGHEPSGPDQNLPMASDSSQLSAPNERKATSYINNHSLGSTGKYIPRLIDGTGGISDNGELCPAEWNVFDVAQFLRVNDCAAYCDTFSKQKIDGNSLLTLTKDQIINFTGMKVGPSLKIFDLIQQLKIKLNPAHSRLMKAANMKKIL